MGCLYMEWSVSIRDGVLVNGMGYYFPVLLSGMGYSYTGCGVSILDVVLKNRTGY